MEKTNTHYRSGVKRLLAFLLCAVCVFGMIPTQAFAFSPGQKASSWLGDQYVGSDGQHYYAPAPYTYLVYNSDGTMDVRSSSGGNAYRHYMLTASDGSPQGPAVARSDGGATPSRGLTRCASLRAESGHAQMGDFAFRPKGRFLICGVSG